MSRHPDETYLKHMRDFAAEAIGFSSGRSRADLDNDRLFALATFRLLEMIGEAASQLSKYYRDGTPQIPWAQLIGLRHRLAHAYDIINPDIIWRILTNDLPQLVAALDSLLSSVKD